MKSTICFLILSFFFLYRSNSYSQNSGLYIPLNIQKVYDNGTRSYNGMPGPNYWQNFADYNINAELDPQTRIIKGEETILYKNNSPDSLRIFVFRLYQDIYKKGNNRDFPVDPSDLTDGMKIKKLVINGEKFNADKNDRTFNRRGTNLFVRLNKPVLPKDSAKIHFEWSFIMPRKTGIRMGMVDSTSFYVGYWFPQVSVYDDIGKWDTFVYTGQQEFYNNFGNFDVTISAPKNYIIWAAGVMQNPDEVFNENILKKIDEAKVSDTVIHIITKEDLKNGKITKGNLSNVWEFKAKNISDFAFAASDHFLWDGGSVVVDKNTGRRTFISAAYGESAKDFPQVADIAMKSIKYFSNDIPGVPFPYPKLTVVNGSHRGGMEYPMMVNDYSAPNHAATVGVTSHEIAHTYFPFYMGTNERKYAWMDEGWATALPVDIQYTLAPEQNQREHIAGIYEEFAGNEFDMPMMVPSVLLNGISYTFASYYRPAEAYLFLRDMLGEKLFLKALHEYIKRWNGKHPGPYDFFFTFNNVTGENLDWYWKPWFFEEGYPDLGIKSVKTEGNKISILVEKIGNIPVPVNLKITYKDGSVDSVYKSVMVWKDGKRRVTFEFNSGKQFELIKLGNSKIPDTDKSNNTYLPES